MVVGEDLQHALVCDGGVVLAADPARLRPPVGIHLPLLDNALDDKLAGAPPDAEGDVGGFKPLTTRAIRQLVRRIVDNALGLA